MSSVNDNTTLSREETKRMLPGSLAEMADVISVDAILKICDRYGGARLYIPMKPRADGALSKLIGFETARVLGKIYGRILISVPRAAQLLKAGRDKELVRQSEQGISVAQLAQNFKITERHVYRVLARSKQK